MNIIEQVYAATVLWWAGFDTLPVVSGITAAVVGISHCYSRQNPARLHVWLFPIFNYDSLTSMVYTPRHKLI